MRIVSSVFAVIATLAMAQENHPALPAAAATAPAARETALPPPPIPESARFTRYFAPLRTDRAAISPDGRYLAFSIREDDLLYVITTDLGHPDTAAAKVLVADSATSTPALSANQYERTPPQILWMRWVSPTRLVLQTNRITDIAVPAGGEHKWTGLAGVVLAFDGDGGQAQVLVTPKDLREDILTPSAGSPFSLRREDYNYDQRINLPNNPAKAPDAPVPTDADPASSSDTVPAQQAFASPSFESAEGDRSSFMPTPPSGSEFRTFRIQRTDPARPSSFLLLATGVSRPTANRSIELLSIDGLTGAQKSVSSDFVRDDRDFLLDQQGRLRITIPNAIIPGFPHAYEYFGRNGKSLRRPLGAAVGNGTEFMVSPENFFGERDIPLGFDRTGEILFYASNRGRATFGVFAHNLVTGKASGPKFEQPKFDLIGAPVDAFPPDTLVFDPHTQELIGIRYDAAMRTAAWLKPEWRDVQGTLERLLPGRAVDLVDWDTAGRRFVVSTQGPADAGAFYLFDREKGRLSEFARRAPWFDSAHTFATLPFDYARADGDVVTGLITVPTQARLKPFPVVVVCPDVPWQRVRSDFRAEIHALTDMGFAVVQINGRGAWGLGQKHRAALKAGYDLVQVEDIVTTLTELQKRFQINLDRVALFGRGHGGFIALRALQEYPARFRCAVTLDATVDLAVWLKESYWTDRAALPQLQKGAFGDDVRLALAPLAKHPEKITKPVLLLSYPGPDGAPRSATYLAARAFAHAVRETADVQFADLPMDYARGLPGARSDAFAKIEEFLNLHIYSYKVKPGQIREIKEPTK